MKDDIQTITVGELRTHLPVFGDDWDLFFGNGNLHFYRTKSRGEKLVQIEFNEETTLLSEQAWIPNEKRRPDDQETVAVICRQVDDGLLRMTGYYKDGVWNILGRRPELNIIEVTHWCYLPEDIPSFHRGDPVQ